MKSQADVLLVTVTKAETEVLLQAAREQTDREVALPGPWTNQKSGSLEKLMRPRLLVSQLKPSTPRVYV